jgi:hypothetical protein
MPNDFIEDASGVGDDSPRQIFLWREINEDTQMTLTEQDNGWFMVRYAEYGCTPIDTAYAPNKLKEAVLDYMQ